ncbi:MAG: hypothetical protein LBG79_05405 [Spirochaetaceae bacterium]|nr:hypothetical protein [Spirochaetaceae bacterium]
MRRQAPQKIGAESAVFAARYPSSSPRYQQSSTKKAGQNAAFYTAWKSAFAKPCITGRQKCAKKTCIQLHSIPAL